MPDIDAMRHMEDRVRGWVLDRETIRAAVIVGSRARTDHPADEWSDLDVMLFTSDPDALMTDRDWLSEVGEVWMAVRHRTSGGDPEWLVLYKGGLGVDFILCPVDYLSDMRDPSRIPDLYLRGARVLVDKDGLAAKLDVSTSRAPPAPTPSPEEFALTCIMFWYLAVYVEKQIRRGDLWMTQVRQGHLRDLLLRMLEWHAACTRGPGIDTWHMGRFMANWADPAALVEIGRTFARYDAAECRAALLAAMTIFGRLAEETASVLGYAYPEDIDRHTWEFVRGH